MVTLPLIGIDASRAASTTPTGTETYTIHLTRALLTRAAHRYTFRLYFNAPPSTPWPGADIRLIPFPRLWTHLRLSWEMLHHPPHLLFVPAHVLPLIHPRQTLVTVHDLGYHIFPQTHPFRQRLYLEWSTRWNVHVASHVLADSYATRADILRIYSPPADKISVVYPGFDTDLTPVRDTEKLAAVRRRYHLPEAYILYLGRIQPRKNLRRLVNAFATIAPRFPRLHLVLAGPTGWLTAPIRAQVRELGLDQRVHFTGYIAAEDKAALISAARLFAYPSLHEGFGFPVLEAQACGTPLLTSTTSSLPEVAGDGGLLVNPLDETAIAQGLTRLLTDEALRRTLIARGETNLRRFSWTRAADTVLDIIASLLT